MKILDEDRELLEPITMSDSYLPEINVYGTYEYIDYNPWSYQPSWGGGASSYPESIHSTPAPSAVPAGVDLEYLRDLVNLLAIEMLSSEVSLKSEQGVMIVRQANGLLRVGNIEVGTKNGVKFGINVEEGELVVASVHTHTPIPGTFVGIPSDKFNHAEDGNGPGDTADMAAMMSSGRIDPGALYYVVDVEHATTYEYTWSGPEVRVVGPDITHDTVY